MMSDWCKFPEQNKVKTPNDSGLNLGNGWKVAPGNSNSPFPSTPATSFPPKGAELSYSPNPNSNVYMGGYSHGNNSGVYGGFRMRF